MATKAELQEQVNRLEKDLRVTSKKYRATLQYLYDAIRPQYTVRTRTDSNGDRTYTEKLERVNNFNGFSGPDDHPIKQYLKDALKKTEQTLGIQPDTTLGHLGMGDWNDSPELAAAQYYRAKYKRQWDIETNRWIRVKKIWVDRDGKEVEGYDPNGSTHYYNKPFVAWVPVTQPDTDEKVGN